MAEGADEDPFERAARRERREAMRAQPYEAMRAAYGLPHGYEPNAAAGMLGVTAAWAVIVWLHAFLGDTDTRLFRIHFVVFVLFAAITAGVVVNALAKRVFRRPRGDD